jgi:hypothetical protein
MAGDIQSVALSGTVNTWPQAVYFDTSSEILRLTSSSFTMAMSAPQGSPIVVGSVNDSYAIQFFNENTSE